MRTVRVTLLFLACTALSSPWCQAQSFQVGLNFTGNTKYESFFPKSDAHGAVGPNHFIEFSDGRFAVYSKADGRLQSPLPGLPAEALNADDFWGNLGITVGNVSFNPRVLYDPFAQRWYAASSENPNNPNRFLFAVSNSSDPTQGWHAFGIDSDNDDTRWQDFPRLGFDQAGVYMVGFDKPVTGQTGSPQQTIVAIPKADLLLPTPTVANATTIEELPLYLFNGTYLSTFAAPVTNLDNTGMPLRLLSNNLTDQGKLSLHSLNGPITNPTITGGDIVVNATAYGLPQLTPIPGATAPTLINTQSPRFAANPVMVDGSIWGVQTVSQNGRNAVRWVEINSATNQMVQEGLIASTTQSYIFPSIAVNQAGKVVIGFQGASATQSVSSYAVLGQTVGSTTTFGAPQLLQRGDGTYPVTAGNPYELWGDYSATVVDPVDPNTFWTYQQVQKDDGNWGVAITQLKTQFSALPASDMTVVSYDNDTAINFNGATAVHTLAGAAQGHRLPSSAQYDSAGNLYMADLGQARVVKIDPSGSSTVYADAGDDVIAPLGLAIKPSNGHLFVSNLSTAKIIDISNNGGLGTDGTVFADSSDGLRMPWDMVFDASGNMYVADVLARTIFKFNSAGTASVFADGGDGLATPLGLAIDGGGNIYVSDLLRNQIRKFTPGGVGSIIADQSDGVLAPAEIEFGPDGLLYITGYLTDQIWRLDSSGNVSLFADHADGIDGPFDLAFKPGAGLLSVPEPGGLALALCGAACLWAAWRKRS